MAGATGGAPAPFKLSAVKEPKFQLETPDGKIHEFDPWEVGEKIDGAIKLSDGAPAVSFDRVRIAFGFPSQADADAAPDPKPYTPTRHACIALQAALADFVANLSEVKKLSAHSQR